MEKALLQIFLMLNSISGISAAYCTFYGMYFIPQHAYCNSGCCTNSCCGKDDDDDADDDDKSDNIAIAGIVIGGSVAIVLIVAIAFIICHYKKKKEITSRVIYSTNTSAGATNQLPYPTTQFSNFQEGSQMPGFSGYSNNQQNNGNVYSSKSAEASVPPSTPQGMTNQPIISPPPAYISIIDTD